MNCVVQDQPVNMWLGNNDGNKIVLRLVIAQAENAGSVDGDLYKVAILLQ